MNEKLITIVVLPYAKAHILKLRLEAQNIKCELEDYHLIEAVTSSTVRVKILEKDVNQALSELNLFLGIKPETVPEKPIKRQVLLPIDFSETSEKAGLLAFSIAKHLNAELLIMHSYISPINYAIPIGDIYPVDPSPFINSTEVEQTANKDFQAFIKKLKAKIPEGDWEQLNPTFMIKPGYPNDDILAYAKEHQPRLIVLGKGSSNSHPGTVGSVAVDVMFNACVPVLVVPAEMPDKKIVDFKEVLYATNFDAKDFTALDKLMKLLNPFDMKVSCAHVGEVDKYAQDNAQLAEMKNVLQEKYKNRSFKCTHIMGSDVADSLEKYVKDNAIDALALTTHKRGMLTRLFNPSLARQMAIDTHLPLLVFHA